MLKNVLFLLKLNELSLYFKWFLSFKRILLNDNLSTLLNICYFLLIKLESLPSSKNNCIL